MISGEDYLLIMLNSILKSRRLIPCFLTWLASLLMLTSSLPLYAEGFSIVLNGASVHVNPSPSQNFNEENWGLGFQYDFAAINKRWIPFISASGFQDSLDNTSYYAGGGVMRRFIKSDNLNIDAGLIGFMMTREDYKDNDPFPGILPVFSIGNEKIALNITYIPKVHPKIVPVWFFQLKVPLSNFN